MILQVSNERPHTSNSSRSNIYLHRRSHTTENKLGSPLLANWVDFTGASIIICQSKHNNLNSEPHLQDLLVRLNYCLEMELIPTYSQLIQYIGYVNTSINLNNTTRMIQQIDIYFCTLCIIKRVHALISGEI